LEIILKKSTRKSDVFGAYIRGLNSSRIPCIRPVRCSYFSEKKYCLLFIQNLTDFCFGGWKMLHKFPLHFRTPEMEVDQKNKRMAGKKTFHRKWQRLPVLGRFALNMTFFNRCEVGITVDEAKLVALL